MVAAPSASPSSTRTPPAAQASVVGGIEMITVARPPSATNPMTPTLNSPAKPHCRFTPSAMTALISPKFRINSAEFQLCTTPVPMISTATRMNSAVALTVSLIPTSP